MPIYEFECLDCHRKTTALVMNRERIGEVRCRKCGGANLEKLFSRFATPKSEDARLESLADPGAMGDIDESDPQSVARFMKRMGQEMGEDFGDDIDQAIEEEMHGGGEDGPEGAGESSEDL
ncbi:MAG TPA: zinc ribbon domain-containing protein [Vicinamibacterales bacterium]|nr:zinc ribbon domain-containing protein [Vicinamibacterales bacterium]